MLLPESYCKTEQQLKAVIDRVKLRDVCAAWLSVSAESGCFRLGWCCSAFLVRLRWLLLLVSARTRLYISNSAKTMQIFCWHNQTFIMMPEIFQKLGQARSEKNGCCRYKISSFIWIYLWWNDESSSPQTTWDTGTIFPLRISQVWSQNNALILDCIQNINTWTWTLYYFMILQINQLIIA